MKVILSKIIKDKEAKLVLDENTMVVSVIYDGDMISSHEDATWANLEKSKMFDEYLEIITESYIEKKEREEAFGEYCKKIGW